MTAAPHPTQGNPGLTADILPYLQPGDLLIYSRNAFFSKCIKLKTWSPYSHVETFLGGVRTHAARDSSKFWGKPSPGTGVGTFEINFDGLVLVRRPPFGVFNMPGALAYAARVDGQRYDVAGIFRFFTIGKQSLDKQFCSEDATRLARAAGVEPFTTRLDADLVSPRDLAFTPVYTDIMAYGDQGFAAIR